MDLKDTVLVLCTSQKGISKDMVSAEWNDQYNMKRHSLHNFIEELWVEKSKNSIRLFNATKFRFHGLKMDHGNQPKVNFFLGTTSYKEFIGTNCAPFADKLVCDGNTDHSNSQSYLADPVGVGGMLETSDKDLIFMRRSSICAEMPGLLDRPGGHPEPDEVISKYGTDKDIDSSKIVDELFDSVCREIQDEINIPLEKLASPLLLGISYNPGTWKRPSLEFYTRCYLSTKEVLDLYAEQTQAESEESTDLVVIPISKILDFENFKKNEIFNELTHTAKSAIYCLLKFYAQS